MATKQITPSFDRIVAAVTGEPVYKGGWLQSVWPELADGEAEFLASCPVNRTGWHWYQVPGGPVIHYKTGTDFRNPSLPYHIVKVAGRQVLSLIGYNHHPSGNDPIFFEEGPKREWFAATVRGRTVYMPADWQPTEEALATYRRFCGGGWYARKGSVAEDGERRVLWGASLSGLYGGETEVSLRESINHCRQWPSEYSVVEVAVSRYCFHMLRIHFRVKELGYLMA